MFIAEWNHNSNEKFRVKYSSHCFDDNELNFAVEHSPFSIVCNTIKLNDSFCMLLLSICYSQFQLLWWMFFSFIQIQLFIGQTNTIARHMNADKMFENTIQYHEEGNYKRHSNAVRILTLASLTLAFMIWQHESWCLLVSVICLLLSLSKTTEKKI